ncbi:hypothetical protein V8F20_008337 [Naviculisporaceae sp. PSN 640]
MARLEATGSQWGTIPIKTERGQPADLDRELGTAVGRQGADIARKTRGSGLRTWWLKVITTHSRPLLRHLSVKMHRPRPPLTYDVVLKRQTGIRCWIKQGDTTHIGTSINNLECDDIQQATGGSLHYLSDSSHRSDLIRVSNSCASNSARPRPVESGSRLGCCPTRRYVRSRAEISKNERYYAIVYQSPSRDVDCISTLLYHTSVFLHCLKVAFR